MADSFDLHILPLYRVKGKEWPQLPGLLAAAPPRHPARGREGDRLFVHLSLAGNIPIPSAEYDRLTGMLAERFYKTPGAVTSALRAAAERINEFLLERNVRTKGKNQHVLGRLVMGVLRGRQVVLALCGAAHVFHLQGGVQHIHEEGSETRSLGSSQATPIYFSQVQLSPGGMLVVCPALPAGWEEALQNSGAAGGFETLRRRLFSASQEDVSALLIQARPGKGALNMLTPRPEPVSAPAPAGTEDSAPVSTELPADASPAAPHPPEDAPEGTAPARPTSQVVSGQAASRFARLIAGQPETPAAEEAQAAPPPAAAPEAVNRPARAVLRPQRAAAPGAGRFIGPHPPGAEIPEIVRPASQKRQQMFRGLAKSLRGVRVFLHNAAERLRAFLPKLLPDLRSEEPKVSGTSLAFLAIAIPVLVVTAALVFYNQHGKTTSYQENFNQALAAAAWAAEQTDPANIRVGWERTLYFLDLAERYQVTNDSRTLRGQAQAALDTLDSILRLSFAPAVVNGVNRSINVKAMAATANDLYLLDGTSGAVTRYYAGSQGYQLDSAFVCRPGVYQNVTVGPLVDIIAAPKVNPYNATLLALDAKGVLLYCFPSPLQPFAVPLSQPELGLHNVTGFTLDMTTNYLYLLDPSGKAIWYYEPDGEGKYASLPSMFFGEQVPAGMELVIDLATNGSDMYLLFEDGHVAACTLIVFQNVPKRCVDVVQFVDNRPGHQSGDQIIDAAFTQMMFADAPDQSLYLFDPYSQAIYRFSSHSDSLVLLNQIRAAEDERAVMMNSPAMAMTISPNRSLFIAVTGQVYYAANIP